MSDFLVAYAITPSISLGLKDHSLRTGKQEFPDKRRIFMNGNRIVEDTEVSSLEGQSENRLRTEHGYKLARWRQSALLLQ